MALVAVLYFRFEGGDNCGREFTKLPGSERPPVLFSNSLGCVAFQEPTAGVPVAAGSVADRVESKQFGVE